MIEKFTKAHDLARQLLAGPDLPVVIPQPTFDMPGCYTVFPVKMKVAKVQEVEVVYIFPNSEVLEEANGPSAESQNPGQ